MAVSSDFRELSTPYTSCYRILLIIVSLCFISLVLWWNVVGEIRFYPDGEKLKDFPIRSTDIARDQWPRIDNQTCLPEGLPEYPKNGTLQRRLPYAIVMGSMKSGTTALSIYLYQHPNIVRPTRKELHFFDFQYEFFASADGIHRKSSRQRYRQAFDQVLEPIAKERLESNSQTIAIDDSPRYIFWSDRVPARVLCVAPWAKMLAILRNPIDRAYSHYNMMQRSNRRKRNMQKRMRLPTFEEWIDMDMQLLNETGVVQDKIPQKDFAGSTEEMEAWKKYTRLGKHSPVGRGLYAIQLRHWFQAYEAAGRSRSDFLIIQSERMRADKSGVYAEVLDFLGIEKYELDDEEDEPNTGKYKTEMKKETRKRLDEFYRPYNQELYALLGKDWEGVWDP